MSTIAKGDGKGERSFVGIALSFSGVACALVGPFSVEGVSIELLGIILGTLSCYSALHKEDRLSLALGLTSIMLCCVALVVSGMAVITPVGPYSI